MRLPIRFSKLSGTGNDFIVIDHRRALIPPEEQASFARAVCRRNFSVGADGLILIESSEEADFAWRFFNSVGSAAEMCGNGARCAARFAHANGIAPARMRFATAAGIVAAEVLAGGDTVRVGLTPPRDLSLNIRLLLDGQERTVHFLNTGVPHVVLFTDGSEAPVQRWGRELRFHKRFQPAGANANFVQITGAHELTVRTYERGVEAETLACGTGATAAAVIAALLGHAQPPVTVTTSGGQRLTIDFRLADQQTVESLTLEGPALHIYDGELYADALAA